MKVHNLKTWSIYLRDIANGVKNFEVRRNDRDFKEGDILNLKEWNETTGYTGNIIQKRVTYILHGGAFGIEEGFVVMGLGAYYWNDDHLAEDERDMRDPAEVDNLF